MNPRGGIPGAAATGILQFGPYVIIGGDLVVVDW